MPILQFAVPIGEVVLAALLALGVLRVGAAAAALFVSLTFVGVHATAWYAGVFVPCGCMGLGLDSASGGGYIWMLLLSLGMAAASGLLLIQTLAARLRAPVGR